MDSLFFKKLEYKGLKNLYQTSPRNPFQLNGFNLADVESVKITKKHQLVASSDSIAIEIHSGLYKHPETWGYLAIANSVSDLAASGAQPVGILVSAQWKTAHEQKIRDQVYRAMSKALQQFQVPLLGGDSGSSAETVLSTTIIGLSQGRTLTREGISPGDLILCFGDFFGWGPALAFDYLKNKSRGLLEKKFRPAPSWQTTQEFKKYFSASIDSSDGIYNSLDTLAKINNVHFRVDTASIPLSRKIRLFQKKYKLPIQYFIESDLGDLQTCVALSQKSYLLIRNRLPFHSIVAQAEKPNTSKKCIVYSDHKQLLRSRYRSLPEQLAISKMNYSSALDHWLSQY